MLVLAAAAESEEPQGTLLVPADSVGYGLCIASVCSKDFISSNFGEATRNENSFSRNTFRD
jgi:hypothetical protein